MFHNISSNRLRSFRHTCKMVTGLALLLAVSAQAIAQQKPFQVKFTNRTGQTVDLMITFPQPERIGRLQPGRSVEVDFNRGERVRVTYAGTGIQLGVLNVTKSQNLVLTNPVQQPRNNNFGPGLTQSPDAIPGGSGGGTGNPDAVGKPPMRGSTGPRGKTNPLSLQLSAEGQAALLYVNTERGKKGLPPFRWNAKLQEAAERRARHMVSLSKNWSDILIPTEHLWFDPQTRQQIGMNKWVREAGYPLPEKLGNLNHVESTYADGASDFLDVRGLGRRVIGSFLGEGPGGGHYDAMMSDNRDFAFAFAQNAARQNVFVCVLTSKQNFSPFLADLRPPGQRPPQAGSRPATGAMQNVTLWNNQNFPVRVLVNGRDFGRLAGGAGSSGIPLTQPAGTKIEFINPNTGQVLQTHVIRKSGNVFVNANSTPAKPTTPKPLPTPDGPTIQHTVVNKTRVAIPISVADPVRGVADLGTIAALQSKTFSVGKNSTIHFVTPSGNGQAKAATQQTVVADRGLTLQVGNPTNARGSVELYLPRLVTQNGQRVFRSASNGKADKVITIEAGGATRELNLPIGTYVKISGPSGSSRQKLTERSTTLTIE